MDPLSVAASVTGLIMAGSQITSLIQRLLDAPALALAVASETSHFVIVLSQLQPFLSGASGAHSRTSLIEVQQLQIILTGSVFTLSELQSAVAAICQGSSTVIGIRERMKWLMAESAISLLIQRVRDHKSSLTLILTLLTCQSTSEAMSNMAQLRVLLEHFIQHNTQLFHRVQELEDQSHPGAPTVQTTTASSRRPFENVLLQSDLYQRSLDGGKPAARHGPSGNWSIASGLSLAQVPDIRSMRLAVSLAELSNPQCYTADGAQPVISLLHQQQRTSNPRSANPYRRSLSTWDNTVWDLVKSGADKEAVYPVTYPAVPAFANDTPMMGLNEACKYGAHHTVRLWLERGASTASPNSAGDFALHVASRNGHHETATVLLQWGAAVDARNEVFETPLHLAATNGHQETVQVLLGFHAATDATNLTRDSALHLAAAHGQLRAVAALLAAGADMHAERDFGYRAVHLAALGGHGATLVALVRAGAGKDTRNPYGRTPLHFAACAGKCETVRELLQFGAEIDGRSRYGDSPLHVAASHGDEDTIRLLLEMGAELEAQNERGDRPLHVAVRNAGCEAVRVFLEAGADVEAENQAGHRPVHVAIDAGKKECVVLLFEAGADLGVLDGCGASNW